MPKRSSKRGSGWIDFAAVKRQISMEQLLEHYDLVAELEEKDDGYCGPCPFHEGDSPRPFHVSTSKNAWYCHGCEEGGNVLDFAARMEDVSIRKAAGILADAFGLTDTKKPRDEPRSSRKVSSRPQGAVPAETESLSGPQSADLDHAQGVAPPDSSDVEYRPPANEPLSFSLKGLDPEHEALGGLGFQSETIRFFEAGFCSRGLMAGRLAVPIHSPTGELLAYAGRSLEEDASYKYPEQFGRELELYNLHRAVSSEEHSTTGLILVADVLDVWRLSEAGYPNAIASMATVFSEEQLLLLATYAAPTKKVLLLREAQERDNLVARLSAHVFVRTLGAISELTFQELCQLFVA